MRNFENILKELSPEKIKLADQLLMNLKSSRNEGRTDQLNPISAKTICKKWKEFYKIEISDVEIRQMVNYLRKRFEPIGSNSKGYWYMKHAVECNEVIEHLSDRESAIRNDKLNLIKIKEKLNENKVQENIFEIFDLQEV